MSGPKAAGIPVEPMPAAGDDLVIEAGPADDARIAAAAAEIDLADSRSIVFFGSKMQQQLTTVSDTMLEAVRAKEVGPAGDALGRLVRKLRELDVSGIDPSERPGFLGRLLGMKSEVMKYVDRYEDVRDQVDAITDELERHKTTLLTDIVRLDRLYDATLDYFRGLEAYIAAGQAKLAELDQGRLPALAAEAERSADVVVAQQLRDLRGVRDDLERRVHDLLLTRQVTMQSLPSIRLVQENDKALVAKIGSTIANTVPLWRQQLAQALTVFRAGEAAQSVKAASDLTNELLRGNAERLRQVNAEVRGEIERGVFDLDAVRQANEQLIGTIEDSLRIADEGKARRARAEAELQALEGKLKAALVSARAAGGTRP